MARTKNANSVLILRLYRLINTYLPKWEYAFAMDLNGQNRILWWKFDQSIFKEVIFVWLDELDNLYYGIHAWIRINIQPHVSAENIVLNGLSG